MAELIVNKKSVTSRSHKIVCNIIPELKSFNFLHDDCDKELFVLNYDGLLDEGTLRQFDIDLSQEYFPSFLIF